jgi:diguanylate cyclase
LYTGHARGIFTKDQDKGTAPMGAAVAARANERDSTSHAVITSMRRHGVRFTANNFAVWHCYLSGSIPALQRAIRIVLSNGGAVDEAALHRLYTKHFCPARRATSVRDQAKTGLDRLKQARAMIAASPEPAMPEAGPPASDAAALDACLEAAAERMQEVIAGTEALLGELSQSQQRVALLEDSLNDATRDASTDSLTGLLNRRAFDAALRSMAADAMNSGFDLGFVLLDIDHFKMVNDQWGHPAGDDVLRRVAALLMRTVRGGDLVARYGGEEFAVILPNTGRRGALAVAENLREAVCSEPCNLGAAGSSLGITISAGISCYAPGEGLGNWLGRADAALYCAKHAGRNRVVFGTAGNMPHINGAPSERVGERAV